MIRDYITYLVMFRTNYSNVCALTVLTEEECVRLSLTSHDWMIDADRIFDGGVLCVYII